MRCRYLEDGQCKSKATVWYRSIGICDEHKELLKKIIEKKGNTAEFVFISTKRRPTKRVLDSAFCACQLFFDDGRSDPAVCEFCGKPQSQ